MRRILPVIVVAQFLCTTLWFVGNAVMPEIVTAFGLDKLFFASQTSAVQLGFIIGTLTFALLSIADRFSPSKVFFTSSLLAAAFNVFIVSGSHVSISILTLRFLTGFFLAGIYPVGMKIAADYFDKGLGKSLGFLVGALVLGTAFPHLLRGYLTQFPWEYILTAASCLAVAGGTLILLYVPDGPHRQASGRIDLSVARKVFEGRAFRSAAFGYFGHMWELYTFWAFVPLMLSSYAERHPGVNWNVSVWSFSVIGIGSLACMGAGFLSARIGERTTATLALAASGLCCLVSPLAFAVNVPVIYLLFLVFWGIVVIADSPMFSTLVARNAHAQQRGTALTLVNCIGFFITIVSIQFITGLIPMVDVEYLFLVLSVGPALGLVALAAGKKHGHEPAL
jgi:MFS family permease